MSEELKAAQARIACLEGEIAKRDEELAACRVAVENCDLFRARIVELEADRNNYADMLRDSDAELAAIKAQEPAFMWHKGATEDESEVVDVDCACPCCVPLYAAPVSEAKAQGVDGWDVAGDILEKLSAAQAIIDGLRGEVAAQRVKTCIALKERNDAREERDAALVECERRQMQLAACGVVALANTIESAGEARQMHPDYMSASCSDVADAVDREIALRAEREDMRQQIAVRDEEIERIRVQLMTIYSAEPARHSIEWAKAMAATGNNEVYAKWREAFDQRDHQAQRIGELERLLRATGEAGRQLSNAAYNLAQREGHELTKCECALLSSLRKQWDAALSAGKEGE